MRRVLKKLVIAILIILILNNFLISNSAFAFGSYSLDDITDIFTNILGGVIGLLTWPLRISALFAGYVMKLFTSLIAYTEGTTSAVIDTSAVTPLDIFFNNIKLFDINFFDIGTETNFINTMRSSVAGWYYVMRTLAAAILLVIFIYVGIRMAISTLAEEKAEYKKMLVNWLVSILLIFLMQYIVIFTINCNNGIIEALKASVNTKDIEEVYKELFMKGTSLIDLNAIAATIIYCMLVWQTLGLVFAYFSRMLKIAFLIIISPLITLTYSIDKMGDGKAQALNAWLKEFVFTVLIQPFHCVIYMCLVDMAFGLLTQPSDATQKLARSIIAILMIRFVKEAEKIIRKIFAFRDDNSKTSVAAGMAASAVALNQAKNIGKNTRKAVSGAKNLGKSVASLGKNAKVEALAIGSMLTNKDGLSKSFAERKEEVRIDLNNKRADQIAQRSGAFQSIFNQRNDFRVASEAEIQRRADSLVYSGRLTGNKISREKAVEQAKKETFSSEVNAEKERILQSSNGTISEKEAESMARLKVAKDHTVRGKAIKGAKGKVDKLKSTLRQSHIYREASDFAKHSVTAGIGLMVGSGIYGTGGNIATAIGVGAATFKGTQEFLRSSGKTISSGISNNLKDMGLESSADARAILTEVSQNADKYDYLKIGETDGKATQELDKVLKELKAAMDKMGRGKEFQSFRTNAMDILRTSPINAPDKIAEELKDLYSGQGNYEGLGAFSIEDKDHQGRERTVQDAIQGFSNKVSIQYQLKQAENAEMDTNTIINNIVEEFTPARDKKYEEIINTSVDAKADDTIESYDDKDTTINAEMRRLTDEQVRVLIDTFDERIKQESDRINSQTEVEARQKIVETIRRLKVEQGIIIAKAMKDASRELDFNSNLVHGKYQRKLDEAAESLQEELDIQVSTLSQARTAETSQSYAATVADMEHKKSAVELYTQAKSARIKQEAKVDVLKSKMEILEPLKSKGNNSQNGGTTP